MAKKPLNKMGNVALHMQAKLEKKRQRLQDKELKRLQQAKQKIEEVSSKKLGLGAMLDEIKRPETLTFECEGNLLITPSLNHKGVYSVKWAGGETTVEPKATLGKLYHDFPDGSYSLRFEPSEQGSAIILDDEETIESDMVIACTTKFMADKTIHLDDGTYLGLLLVTTQSAIVPKLGLPVKGEPTVVGKFMGNPDESSPKFEEGETKLPPIDEAYEFPNEVSFKGDINRIIEKRETFLWKCHDIEDKPNPVTDTDQRAIAFLVDKSRKLDGEDFVPVLLYSAEKLQGPVVTGGLIMKPIIREGDEFTARCIVIMVNGGEKVKLKYQSDLKDCNDTPLAWDFAMPATDRELLDACHKFLTKAIEQVYSPASEEKAKALLIESRETGSPRYHDFEVAGRPPHPEHFKNEDEEPSEEK